MIIALRQPAEPVSVLLLWAAPRRFPAHDGVALRAVDRWRRRLHLVAERPLGLAMTAEAIRTTPPRPCLSVGGALSPTGCCSHLTPTWPCSTSCPSPLPVVIVVRDGSPPTTAARWSPWDWGLLATFACFFVFAGNMARVPEVYRMAFAPHGRPRSARERRLKPDHQQRARGRACSPISAGAWQPLLIGVNIGGAGTARRLAREPHHAACITPACAKCVPQTAALPELSTSRVLILFSVLNFAFLDILLIACGMTSFF